MNRTIINWRIEARDKVEELAKKWMNYFAFDLVLASTHCQFAKDKDVFY